MGKEMAQSLFPADILNQFGVVSKLKQGHHDSSRHCMQWNFRLWIVLFSYGAIAAQETKPHSKMHQTVH